MVQKVNYKFIVSFLLTDIIKENEDLLCKKIQNLNPKISKTKSDRLFVQSKCTECGITKSRFVKEQEVKGFLSNLGIKTPLSKIPLFNVLF